MSLIKHLSPFAPDQSGAVAALFELGGIIVIADAGGCTGNICGFDEPRWFEHKSAVFSAGLRDMDAILGRDDELIAKLADAASWTDASFAAIVGTPVPAVIGTDFRALRRMAEKRCGIPAITVETLGTELYDRGEDRAWRAIFRTFATEKLPVETGTVGVLGATPLEFGSMSAPKRIAAVLLEQRASEVRVFGMGSGLDAIRRASEVERNVVVSPAGLATARFLKERFDTPYEISCPALPDDFTHALDALHGPGTLAGKRILVVHQQVLAHEVAKAVRAAGATDVTCASWFMLDDEVAAADTSATTNDVSLSTEEEFIGFIVEGGFDVVIGDIMLKAAVPGFAGEFIDLPHFAVSGRVLD